VLRFVTLAYRKVSGHRRNHPRVRSSGCGEGHETGNSAHFRLGLQEWLRAARWARGREEAGSRVCDNTPAPYSPAYARPVPYKADKRCLIFGEYDSAAGAHYAAGMPQALWRDTCAPLALLRQSCVRLARLKDCSEFPKIAGSPAKTSVNSISGHSKEVEPADSEAAACCGSNRINPYLNRSRPSPLQF
jgi:hypothetical protein